MQETFVLFLWVMSLLAVGVFVALYFFEAGYGYLFNPKYGFPVPNKIGWVLMESLPPTARGRPRRSCCS